MTDDDISPQKPRRSAAQRKRGTAKPQFAPEPQGYELAEEEREQETEMRQPTQQIKVLGALLFCSKCDKEVAAYYCSCGEFFCTIDLINHVCATTLKRTFSYDLKSALR